MLLGSISIKRDGVSGYLLLAELFAQGSRCFCLKGLCMQAKFPKLPEASGMRSGGFATHASCQTRRLSSFFHLSSLCDRL